MEHNEIVYFGDPKSVYNINLMKEMRKNNYKVSCYKISEEINNAYKNGKEIKNSLFRKVKKYKLCKLFFSRFNKKDIAHIQFVSFDNLFYLPFFINKFRYYVLSFWGSDLLRQSNKKLILLLPLFVFSKKITFETEEMKEIFITKLPVLKNSKKLCFARFGLSELDEIDNVSKKDIEEFSKKYSIDSKRYKVVVGYNRRKEQQHLKVLNSMSDDVIRKIQIIIPWTYGEVEPKYGEKLYSLLNEKNFNYIFLKDFLTEREVACLRLITDIFVQVQTTDSLSACMLESLYAKKIVITGNWLPYKFLDEKGIIMDKVDKPEGVSDKLKEILKDFKRFSKGNNNSIIVSSFSKWNFCIQQWCNLYK